MEKLTEFRLPPEEGALKRFWKKHAKNAAMAAIVAALLATSFITLLAELSGEDNAWPGPAERAAEIAPQKAQ